ncbi:MAG TPA: helix-turn-helix domain-containing protein, partial [Kiloniellaceae bacterium]
RLNVVNIQLPPLRARPQDIPILAQHFAAKYSEANGLSATLQITPQALEVLRAHHWRGNVRELENTMHRAVLLAQDGRIGPEAVMLTGQSLSQAPQRPESDEAAGNGSAAAGEPKHLVGRTVADVEKDLILDTLDHCLGNRTHAATILGISIRTLRNKLKLYSEDGVPVRMPGEAERSLA